jgi:hypothetical protein
MSTSHEIAMAGAGRTPPATVKVWDLFVRIFHWSVVLFAIAYVTGDEVQGVHIIAGYVVAALVALRIVWGFVGPRHARFADFVRTPREVLAYFRDLLQLRAQRYIGHNHGRRTDGGRPPGHARRHLRQRIPQPARIGARSPLKRFTALSQMPPSP